MLTIQLLQKIEIVDYFEKDGENKSNKIIWNQTDVAVNTHIKLSESSRLLSVTVITNPYIIRITTYSKNKKRYDYYKIN